MNDCCHLKNVCTIGLRQKFHLKTKSGLFYHCACKIVELLLFAVFSRNCTWYFCSMLCIEFYMSCALHTLFYDYLMIDLRCLLVIYICVPRSLQSPFNVDVCY